MPPPTELKTGFCALCRSRCGARFEVQDDQLIAAHPEPKHPTGVALCTKGRAAPEIWDNPNRLLYPMRRTTPKGSADPGWIRITWDEALDEIAQRLGDIRDTYGPEQTAFAITTPSGTPISDSNDWIDRFIRVYGSPNTINGIEICNWHKDYVQKLTNGSGVMYPDYLNTDLVFLWGFNPSATWLDQATQISAARARGARIISVDPRRAGFAGSATQWLRVRPGGDGILAMGMMRLLIERGGYDAAFVRRWTSATLLVRADTSGFLRGADIGRTEAPEAYVAWNGGPVLYHPARRTFDAGPYDLILRGEVDVKIAEHTVPCRPAFDLLVGELAAYTPDRVERGTGIPPEEVEAAVSILAEVKTVAYYSWSGLGQHDNASQTDRAVALLMSLKGCYDAPGGNVGFTKVPSNMPGGPGMMGPEQLDKAIGLVQRPIGPATYGWVRGVDVYRAMIEHDPYPVRALVSFGANIAMSQGDGPSATEALSQLDFHVHCDTIANPTSTFADILLPVNTPWEREGLRIGFEISQEAESLVQLRQQMVPPRGESRSDAEIVFDLAVRMGFGETFFDGDFDRARDWQLEPSGLTLQMLRDRPEGHVVPQTQRFRKYAEETPEGYSGFATETGLVEIYSEPLSRLGHDPVPRFAQQPDNADYPLTLTTAKSPYYCHSMYRDIPSLRRRAPHPRVAVDPTVAAGLGLLEGETVALSTRAGSVRMTLAIDPALGPGTVIADYGWWQGNPQLDLAGFDAFSDTGANYNRLVTSRRSDPISGSVAHRAMPCALGPATINDRGWTGFRDGQIVATTPVAEDCLRFDIRVDGLDILPDYEAGQHIVLRLPDPDGGQDLIRCYSLVGSAIAKSRDVYSIAVRRVGADADGVEVTGSMSGLLHRSGRPGLPLSLMAPKGDFTLPTDGDGPIVMIAGGIGITPFMSYLETLAATGTDRRVHLVMANRHSASHPFAKRLSELRRLLPTLTITTLYSAPLPQDVAGRDFDRTGYVTRDDLCADDVDAGAMQVYHCGPEPMMQEVERILTGMQVPSTRVFSEAFGAGSTAPEATELPEGPFTVTLARSGKSFEWTRNAGPILDAAGRAGLELASGCRVGQCESCALAILRGRARHLRGSLGDRDDRCLTCSAVPLGDLVLDV